VKKYGQSEGLFRRGKPKEDTQRVKNGGFKMSPKRHSRVKVRIPEREGFVDMDLVKQKLLHPQVEGNEIRAKQKMFVEQDIPEEKKDEPQQDTHQEEVLLHAG
jgi:hypothetical protein